VTHDFPFSMEYNLSYHSHSMEGLDLEVVECTYSPAKRRGPTPGRATTASDAQPMHTSSALLGGANHANNEWQGSSSLNDNRALAQQQLAALMLGGAMGGGGGAGSNLASTSAMQQQYQLLQQQLQQQPHPAFVQAFPSSNPPSHSANNVSLSAVEQPTQRRRVEPAAVVAPEIPPTILSHTHMLDRDDPDGSRLRAYYKLSIDEMFRLPCTPSDDDFIAANGGSMAGRHLAALSAVRFAETALGAIVNNEVTLATELCNAVVHCLREAVQDLVSGNTDTAILFEVAKAYFLLGVFRSIRGDMARYFKYRRVSITYLSKLSVCTIVVVRERI
jgi:hypothetical protein